MKLYKLILIATLLFSQIEAATTTTSFEDVNYDNVPKNGKLDDSGNLILFKKVKIKTDNFQVNNFWTKFHDKKNQQSTYSNVATTGLFQLKVQASFACRDGKLDEKGCSGQKPFLVKSGTLVPGNTQLRKDAQGNMLPTGEYRIPFDKADNYNVSNKDAFFAMDVYRDGIYYKEHEAEDYNKVQPKTFFGYFISLIKNYFTPDNSVTIVDDLNTSEAEMRNRYMANITFGLQQDYMLKKGTIVNVEEQNTAKATHIASLLDYNSEMITDSTGCDGAFFSYDPDSITCKFGSFFGLSNWMPFYGNNQSLLGADINVASVSGDSVLEDTETMLLSLASKLDGENYTKVKIDDMNNKSGFISEMFKPMTYMMGSMFRFFFGENSKNLTEIVSVDFNFTKPMPLSFIEVDTLKKVQEIKNFVLLGLESVYGTEVESCTVKKKGSLPFVGAFMSTETTFTAGVPTNTPFDMEAGFFSSYFNNPSEYSELNVTEERHRSFMDWGRHDVVNVSTDDWLDWCKRNQGRQKKSLFGRILDNVTNVFSLNGTTTPTEYDDQLDKLLRDEDYTVKEYKEKVHKGLILHIKENKLKFGQAGTSTSYQLMKVE